MSGVGIILFGDVPGTGEVGVCAQIELNQFVRINSVVGAVCLFNALVVCVKASLEVSSDTFQLLSLSLSLPPEDVPILQKNIIDECRSQAKPVVVATQMLERYVCIDSNKCLKKAKAQLKVYQLTRMHKHQHLRTF